MKFFTPELYLRGQSEDPAVQGEVERLWEEANARYEEHLRTIGPQLPPQVREFNDLLLHDARVLNIARRDDRLTMVLSQDTSPPEVGTLTYTLAGEPSIDRASLPGQGRSAVMEFLYDEIDLVRGDGGPYEHSILFSNGWEMRLRFCDVQVDLADLVYPPPGPTTATGPMTLHPA